MIEEKTNNFVQNLANKMSQERLIDQQSLMNLTHSTSDPKITIQNNIISPKVIKQKNITFGPIPTQKTSMNVDKFRDLLVKTQCSEYE